MQTEYRESEPVDYGLPIGDDILPMNDLIGQTLQIEFLGEINCVHCDRKMKKSFSQGFCYPCFSSLPQADMCIVRPELCHYEKGTCRDSTWGKEHCFVPHTIYLANSSGCKVGITRSHQQVTRWMDQGAIQALAIARVGNRLDSGRVEVALKKEVADKTNWRKMLKGEQEDIDLESRARELTKLFPDDIEVEILNEPPVTITYPVETYPTKITSFNLDKNPKIEGVLNGIKGQYLIFDGGVINMRKYGGYKIAINT